MVYISDDNQERFIKEDVPPIDLTTIMLGIAGKRPDQLHMPRSGSHLRHRRSGAAHNGQAKS